MNRFNVVSCVLFATTLVSFIGSIMGAMEQEKLITDFTPESLIEWQVVNDNVMGGQSSGGFVQEDGVMTFSGVTNTNGGGFSSIRSTTKLNLDLSDFSGIRLRVKGDGRRFTWRLDTAKHPSHLREPDFSFWADFSTQRDEWIVVRIPFSKFVAKRRGVTLDGPIINTADVTSLGVMIYDKHDGPFHLEIDSVYAYTSQHSHVQSSVLREFQWMNRLLVLRADKIDNKNLRMMREEVAKTSAQFSDRDMVLVTLVGDGTTGSHIGVQNLLPQEVRDIQDQVFIRGDEEFAVRVVGKDGHVKLSKNGAVEIEAIYKLIDSMDMRMYEMRGGRQSSNEEEIGDV
eukprot:Selendium_serpulae@DN463_c0_g1_i2.p1